MRIEDHLTLTGTHLYRPTLGLPDLEGLRVLRPGWWLGRILGSRSEPSRALAIALHQKQVRLRLDLSADASEVRAYLQGRLLRSRGEDGWWSR